MQELKGKAVVITGGAKRIGRVIALELARAGADIAITFRTSDRDAKRTIVEVKALGVRAVAVQCDVRDEKSVKQMVAHVRSELGGIDVLVNNAGAYDTVDFEDLTLEQWDEMFATNATGAFLVTKLAAKELRKRKGRIINIGSLGGIRPWASHVHYCSSKAALHMLTQASAKALAPDVVVNCIAPGMIDLGEKKPSATMKKLTKKTPLLRNGSGKDVAIAARFFAGTAQFITGQILVVDGGLGLV